MYCRNDICNNSKLGNVTLCPNCEKDCDFDTLNSSCLLARVTYTVDNTMTVVFAIFMSLWGKFTQCLKNENNVSFENIWWANCVKWDFLLWFLTTVLSPIFLPSRITNLIYSHCLQWILETSSSCDSLGMGFNQLWWRRTNETRIRSPCKNLQNQSGDQKSWTLSAFLEQIVSSDADLLFCLDHGMHFNL